jgi:DNA-binding NarL/FixJ family response regulator
MNRRWTSEHERQLLELRATGLTWRAIAKKVGRSEASVVTRVTIMKARIDRETQNEADFRAASLSPLAGGSGLY